MSSLYVVATPIGNLGDITLRALETLKEVDVIACEDTRRTLKLLNHFGIKKPLISFHQHSKIQKVEQIISTIIAGQDVALVTDAGTPGISDPGQVLIKAAYEAKIKVVPIPGVSALIAIVSISGVEDNDFEFLGFLPHKKGRQTKLKQIAQKTKPVVLYESPYRIKKLLSELLSETGDQHVVVGRELTKQFEEIYRGKISEVLPQIKEKGEFVVIVEGKKSE
ncbi:MAG: 16S rRNA (cytidine(1402)-2'-O)-methyltransferase [Patescibacteria group bacterium]|jgi:16S rRNA (cytidine1402-2'-O)-methyltransferase|nr:16S rRNA (cytidine(1402)-2'-O)-methyltransferase [Patescibacteria group bacterium]